MRVWLNTSLAGNEIRSVPEVNAVKDRIAKVFGLCNQAPHEPMGGINGIAEV